MKWLLWKKLSLGFVLAVIVLIAMGVQVYDGIAETYETTYRVKHTDEVLIKFKEFGSLLKDIETGQRGYVITGQDIFLDPYMQSLPVVWTRLAEIQSLTADNPTQQKNIADLKPLVRNKIAFVQKTIEQRRVNGIETASKTVATGKGRELMWAITNKIEIMEEEENRLLKVRMDANDTTFSNVRNLIIWGSIISIVLIALTGSIVTYTTTKSLKELLRGTAALSAGDFNNRVEVSTNDEIHELAQAFNSMAAKIEQSHEEIKQQSEYLEEEAAHLETANESLQLKNQQLKEMDLEKNEFLGIVSHDLKNPLFGIKGLAQILEKEYKTLTPEEIQDFSTDSRTSADRMFELISNLLDINAIEQNGVRMEIQPFPVVPITEHAFNRFKQRADSKNITLEFLPETTAEALADRSSTLQVLDNVISNAVKYSPFNKTVRVRVREYEGKTICVEVTDEGPGLTEDDKKKLFGKFARLSAQPTGGEHSTGLGLSIVKKLVEAMNGKIWCESELGNGATFIIELPLAPAQTA